MRVEDDIESKTFSFEDLDDVTQNTHCNDKDYSDYMNISELILENIVFVNEKTVFPRGLINDRTRNTLIDRHKHNLFHIKGI